VVEEQGPVPLEDDEDLLLHGVAVRREAELARRQDDVLQAGADQAAVPRQRPARQDGAALGDVYALRLVEAEHTVMALARLGYRQGAGRRVAGPRMLVQADLHPGGSHPRCVRPLHDRRLGQGPLAERQYVQAVRAADQGMGATARHAGDAVALADPAGRSSLPAQARAAQHVEDLLLTGVAMRRRWTTTGGDVLAAHADADASGGRAEVLEHSLDLTLLHGMGRQVIPVDGGDGHLVSSFTAWCRSRPGPREASERIAASCRRRWSRAGSRARQPAMWSLTMPQACM